MKLTSNLFGKEESLIKEAHLYRLPNGCLLVRFDMKEKWTEFDYSNLYSNLYTGTQAFGVEVVELHVELWNDEHIIGTVHVIPETEDEVKLFADAYFLRQAFKHRIHVYVAHKIPMDLDPEELPIMTQEDENEAVQ